MAVAPSPLAGRRVLVTGAAGAFGSATLAALRVRGAEVLGLDVSAAEGVLSCDLTDDDATEVAVAHAVERLGGLDAVVHYAGIGLPVDSGDAPGDKVRRTFEVNLLGAWRVTAAALPALLESRSEGYRPRLVFTASGLAYVTAPFASAYSVSKRALAAYADSVRVEYGSAVAVTTVYPGYVRTPIHRESQAAGTALEGKVPAERLEDVITTAVRVLESRRPPRDVGTTRLGGAATKLARALPALVDRVVLARHGRDLRRGEYDAVALAQRMIRTTDREKVTKR
ncbi:SDR family NAD(P)-dependent oxidoreductase [Allokutzneria oryzae]|uniref:SDR family NAD(P)-dependent oxidoreductase n=1 Tax=Allokutzneria oryzae TaxID=1378989 RepID=A0ABV6A651_9PSEU